MHIFAFLLSVLLFLHLFPTLLASFSFCGVCVAHCSSSCPDVHYLPPCSFLVLQTHVLLSSPTSGATYFCQWAPAPSFCSLSSFFSYQEMRLGTYISGEYVFVQKKRRDPVSNSDRRFREARFRAETRKNAIFLGSIFGEVRIFATRKSAYFRISSVCSSIPPLISHPVGLSPLLRRWCRSLHFLPPCSFLLLRTHISFLLLRTHIFARRAPGPLFCIISDCCLPISFPHKRKCA